MSEGEEREVRLPVSLLNRINDRVQYTDFESTEEYITHILEEVLQHVEVNHEISENSKVDETQVRDRLESLGYIDN